MYTILAIQNSQTLFATRVIVGTVSGFGTMEEAAEYLKTYRRTTRQDVTGHSDDVRHWGRILLTLGRIVRRRNPTRTRGIDHVVHLHA
jgi:hypothetical protein